MFYMYVFLALSIKKNVDVFNKNISAIDKGIAENYFFKTINLTIKG